MSKFHGFVKISFRIGAGHLYGAMLAMVMAAQGKLMETLCRKSFISTFCAIVCGAICLLFSFQAGAAAPQTLEEVITSHRWKWGNMPGLSDLQFLQGGKALYNSRTSTNDVWTWQITGPRTVHLTLSAQESYDVTFDEAVSQFTAVGPGNRKLTGYQMGSGRLIPGLSGNPTTPAVPAPAPSPVPWIAIFAVQLPKATEWVAVPLQMPVPAAVRENIVTMAGAVKAEGFKSPQASKEAYASADLICRTLVGSLDERASTLNRNRQLNGGNLNATWVTAWEGRSAIYLGAIRAEYGRFSDAVMKSEQPPTPPDAGTVASISFPPVPDLNPTPNPGSNRVANQAPNLQGGTLLPGSNAAPGNQAVGQGSALDRGAYDQHRFWRPWWGPWTRYYYPY
jgi:hypothetical protein